MTTSIFARDSTLTRTGEIQDFDQLQMTLRYNDVDRWVLTMNGDSPDAALITKTGGIVVVRDGVTLMSGPVTTIRRMQDAQAGRLEVSGMDDTIWLTRRLGLPVPSGPPYTAFAYDTITGVCETVIRSLVDRNLGPSAIAARQLAGLTLAADGARGTSVTALARFGTLLFYLQDLALTGGDLGFRIVQVGTGLQFQVYVPVDRTATAQFSFALGNLVSYDYAFTVPAANYIYVAGGGEGTARIIDEGSSAASITTFGRFEMFQDRRDTSDATVLAQARSENLTTSAATSSLSMVPIDTAAVTFGTDYNLGDKVTVLAGGDTIRDVVREVSLTVAPSGVETVMPLVGNANARSPVTPDFLEQAQASADRISKLERR